jgi:hypothetical protein
MANLEENLICYKCKKVPRNAIVSWCRAQHLMCQSCYDITRLNTLFECDENDCYQTHRRNHFYHGQLGRQKSQQCENCGEIMETETVKCCEDCQVDWEPVLSPFLAHVLKELPSKCKFTHNGCKVFIMLEKLKVHEVDCVYRNINCPFLDCNDKDVSFIGLGEHLEANHGGLKMINKARSNDFVTLLDLIRVWMPQKLTFRNRSFFTEVHRRRRAASQSRYFWIYFHGTPDEAVHYSYRIKITGRNGKELTFKGKVYSLDETKETIMLSEDIFFLSNGQVKLLQVDSQIHFEITLYSDKEEIKDEDVESGISDDDDEQFANI